MEMEAKPAKKISLFSFILIILSAVFGFPNTAVAFDQMGYASIIWYILAAVTFFLPTSFMFAEYGSAIKDDTGGVYTWLEKSIGTKWAFVGSFIWICEWVLILVNNAPNVMISISTLIFGDDRTGKLSFFGLNSNESISILSVLLVLGITWISCRGIKSVALLSSIGGFFITLITVVFCGASILLIFINHGQLAQPINGIKSFIVSPNPAFQSGTSIMSFVVYAIFAYGGIESAGGIIDKIKNPAKNFPRGIIIAAILMTTLYVVSIFLCGFSINWSQVMGKSNVNLQNIMFILMYNVGDFFGKSIGMAPSAAATLGYGFSRFTGFSNLIGTLGSMTIIVYSPIKAFITGSPAKFWPKRMVSLNKHQMPAFAMWMQAAVIAAILLFTSFGGDDAQKFYTVLTDMMNISNACPYLFLVFAFPFFKKRRDLDRPFVFFKNYKFMMTTVVIVLLVLSFGIIFNLIQPLIVHDYMTAFWTFIGPIFFGGVAYIFYLYSMHKENKLN
ncbi:glutamate/gamma-aminobutyrate family transporter YjeM [Philodulcilactobacillus myokoensis]|uniref:Glutamate/gamma-aminobutyrate family transporter YjeM n=1 Tax=Philodulcilactobacillus myokoensis TaxID=2929573 RepID=A0A9W6B2S8_9LACO|nr:glutamate/gamma-aminobutyrate family transporter YjeM [Philodulcilactobacillus myokoensis]GLB47431.1 glutamate/gamma-aminobutyrate family transporter YjeM [Philodulcilactobacillus myokoensis]